MLPISKEVLLKELELAQLVISKWNDRLNAGIPGVDIPMTGDSDEGIERFLFEFIGEMHVLGHKFEGLAEIVNDMIR